MTQEWAPLEGGYGTMLGVAGPITAAARLGGLAIWDGADLVLECEPAVATPGHPRIEGRRVFWGENVLDLDGPPRQLPGVTETVAGGVSGGPGGGYAPSVYAWGGGRLVVAAGWRGAPPRQPNTRAVLLDGSGEEIAVLWEDGDLAPTAAWAGEDRIVLGSRAPRVYDASGALVRELEPGIPALRVDGDAGLVLIAEPHRVTVWDGEEAIARWPGQWNDAALSGGLVALVDAEGGLWTARPGGAPEPLDAPGPVAAVALGGGRAAIALASAAGVRTTNLA